jgi:hypothetical protein
MYKPALSSVKYISPFGSTYTSVLFTPISRGPGSTSDSENSATKYARELGTGPRRPPASIFWFPEAQGARDRAPGQCGVQLLLANFSDSALRRDRRREPTAPRGARVA